MTTSSDVRPATADRVVISGLGVVSPLACSVESLAAHFAIGEGSQHAAHGGSDTGMQLADMPLDAVPADKRSRIGRLDRLCRVFLSASYLAVDAAGLTFGPDEAERIGLSFGTGLGCLLTNAEYHRKIVESGPAVASPRLFAYTVSSAAAGEVSIALGITGPNVTAHMGFAAGLGAVGYGVDLIQMGKADVVLAGGADVIGPVLIDGLRDMGLLKTRTRSRPFVDEVPGVWPSEGGVVLVLEREDRARRRGVRVWGRLDGYAAGFEPTLTRRTRESTGITATMRRALALSDRVASDVRLVMSSAHGTPVDAVEQQAMEQVFGHGMPQVMAPKAVLGEAFAASGALALALAVGMRSPRAGETVDFLASAPFETPPKEGGSSGRTGNFRRFDPSTARAEEAPPEERSVSKGSQGPSRGPRSSSSTVPGEEGAPAGANAGSVVMVNALCYSGNIVSMIVSPEA